MSLAPDEHAFPMLKSCPFYRELNSGIFSKYSFIKYSQVKIKDHYRYNPGDFQKSIVRGISIDLFRSLTSKYPQYREADTFNPLRQYDFDEEQLLADLDATSEVEKLRQQNFKLNRK